MNEESKPNISSEWGEDYLWLVNEGRERVEDVNDLIFFDILLYYYVESH